MESEEPEIKSKQASKRDRTLTPDCPDPNSLLDISTQDFLISQVKCSLLKNSRLKSPGLKLGDVKFGVELSCNYCNCHQSIDAKM